MEGWESTQRREQPRVNVVPMFVIGAIASIIGVLIALAIDWFPISASEEAKKIDTLYDVLMVVSVPVFVMVQVIVLFAVWKFRMRPGEELLDGPPVHGNTRLEIIWTAVPAVVVVALVAYAYAVLNDIEKDAGEVMKVQVTAEQFAWTYFYPDAGNGKTVASKELYLPVGKQVTFDINAKDVLHSFWVPAFRMKVDAVPGVPTTFKTRPTRLGRYPVVCAELCGLGHSLMRSRVTVLSQKDFDAWLAHQPAAEDDPAAQAGQAGEGDTEGKDPTQRDTTEQGS